MLEHVLDERELDVGRRLLEDAEKEYMTSCGNSGGIRTTQ